MHVSTRRCRVHPLQKQADQAGQQQGRQAHDLHAAACTHGGELGQQSVHNHVISLVWVRVSLVQSTTAKAAFQPSLVLTRMCRAQCFSSAGHTCSPCWQHAGMHLCRFSPGHCTLCTHHRNLPSAPRLTNMCCVCCVCVCIICTGGGSPEAQQAAWQPSSCSTRSSSHG